jgi:Holliday junction resolvase RusA-like endonuclease
MPNHLYIINGEAIPQGSKTATVIKGRAVMFDSNKKLKAWRATTTNQVMQQAKELNFTPFKQYEPVRAIIIIYFKKPKTVKRAEPTVKPDVDKLLRSLFDSMTAAKIWYDDSQVISVTVSKHYCYENDTPKIYINLHTLGIETAKLTM